MQPADKTKLKTEGFLPYAGSIATYTHPKMPGFLFREVQNIEDAVAVGGVMLISSGWFQAYLGLNASMAVGKQTLGKLAMPTKLQFEILKTGWPAVWTSSSGGAASLDKIRYPSHDLFATGWDAVQLVDSSTAVYVAVVTGVDRGYFHLRRVAYGAVADRVKRDYGYDVDQTVSKLLVDPKYGPSTANTNSVGIYYSSNTATSLWMPDVAGYVYKRWALKKREYFTRAFNDMLTSMQGTDDSVIGKYIDACEDELASMGADEWLNDGLRMHATANTEGAVVWTVGDRKPAVVTKIANLAICPAIRETTKSATLPTANTVVFRSYSNVKDGIVPESFLVKIQPWISVVNTQSGTHDNTQPYFPTDTDATNPATLSTAVMFPAVRPEDLNLRFIPWKEVVVTAQQVVNSAAVFACISPIVGPTRVSNVSGSVDLRIRNVPRVPSFTESGFSSNLPADFSKPATSDADYEAKLNSITALASSTGEARQAEIRMESYLGKEVAIVSARIDARVKGDTLPKFNHTHPSE